MKNKTSEKQIQTLSDLLPYFFLDQRNNVIWLKDGSATKSFEVIPKNTLFFTEDEFLTLRQSLTQVLCEIPEKSLLQILFVRDRSTQNSDDAICNWISSHTSKESETSVAEKILLDARVKQIEELICLESVRSLGHFHLLHIRENLRVEQIRMMLPSERY